MYPTQKQVGKHERRQAGGAEGPRLVPPRPCGLSFHSGIHGPWWEVGQALARTLAATGDMIEGVCLDGLQGVG